MKRGCGAFLFGEKTRSIVPRRTALDSESDTAVLVKYDDVVVDRRLEDDAKSDDTRVDEVGAGVWFAIRLGTRRRRDSSASSSLWFLGWREGGGEMSRKGDRASGSKC